MLTLDGGRACAPRPLDDAALDRITAGSTQVSSAPLGVTERSVTTRTVVFEGRVDPIVLPLTETETGVLKDGDQEQGTAILHGSGFAAAGALDAHFSAGAIDFSVTIAATFKVTERTCFLWWCSSDTETTSGSATIGGRAQIGEVSLHMADGVACASIISTCSATGTVTSTEWHERSRQMPGTAAGARGEYVVIGEATLNADVTADVNVSDSAQQAMRALNLGNAARSALANGVNVYRGAMSGGFQQSNVVLQTR
jgi:hypothetical protein